MNGPQLNMPHGLPTEHRTLTMVSQIEAPTGHQRRNSAYEKVSLLDRLPGGGTQEASIVRRGSLPSLTKAPGDRMVKRKTSISRRRSSTLSTLQVAQNDAQRKNGTVDVLNVADAEPSPNRLPPQTRLLLAEPEIIPEEDVDGVLDVAGDGLGMATQPHAAVDRRASLGRYSRHRPVVIVEEDDESDGDGDETISQTESHTSGRSRTLRPGHQAGRGGASRSPGGGKKSLSRRRTEHALSPTPWDNRKRVPAEDCISHIIKFRWHGEAMALFKKSVKKVMNVLAWMVVLSKKDSKIESQLKTFFDMAQELEDSSTMKHIEQQTGISFDPKYFRTSKQQFHLTYELRRCLTLITDFRTEDMVQRVVTGLQHLEAFAEYPLHMQYKLAQVAWYQELPPKRMIIRQGHKAENFYFILSGTGIAKQLVREEDTGRVINRVIARLQKGQSFGEVALVHHTERQATVESVTHMQLLVISREDFLDIFFATTDGGVPEHVDFCRQVDFLRHWPVEKCQEEPEEVLFHYFRRGTVVVQDSRHNDWIYIVKSGTCMVLKKLKSVNPQMSWCGSKSPETALSFPRIGPRIDSRISTARKRYTGLNVPNALSKEMASYFAKQFETGDVVVDSVSTTARSATQDELNPPEVSFQDGGLPGEVAPPGGEAPEVKDTPRSVDTSSSDGQKKRKLAMRSAPAPIRFSPRSNISKPKSIRGVLDAYMKSMETYIMRFKDRSFDDQTSKASMWKERSTEPCFVQLKKLRPRDSFGLEEVEFEDEKRYDVPETSVTLVSNGAEMIMLSRKFFTKYANDHVKRFIREKIRPFPSEETLQENLQHKVNWDLYRQQTVNDVLTYRNDLRFSKVIYNANAFLPCI